jgi:hypothetical protein
MPDQPDRLVEALSASAADTEARDDARRAIRLAAILTLVLCVAGAIGIRLVAKYGLWRRGLFYEQFAAIEAPGIAIVAAFAIAVLVLLARPPEPER